MRNLVASTPTSWNIVLQVLSSFIRSPAILKSPFWGDYVERLQEENDAWPALHHSRPSYSNYPTEAPDVMEQRRDVLAELWPLYRFLNKINNCCCLLCSTKRPEQLELSFGQWCSLGWSKSQGLATIRWLAKKIKWNITDVKRATEKKGTPT